MAWSLFSPEFSVISASSEEVPTWCLFHHWSSVLCTLHVHGRNDWVPCLSPHLLYCGASWLRFMLGWMAVISWEGAGLATSQEGVIGFSCSCALMGATGLSHCRDFGLCHLGGIPRLGTNSSHALGYTPFPTNMVACASIAPWCCHTGHILEIC